MQAIDPQISHQPLQPNGYRHVEQHALVTEQPSLH
jgi:hypothetical protein